MLEAKQNPNKEYVSKKLVAVSKCFRELVVSYYLEAQKALQSIVKYKHASEHEHFYIKQIQKF